MRLKAIFLSLLPVLLAIPAQADTITVPNTFSAGTSAQASQVNANFTAVTTVVNGNLDNSNLKSAAGIALSKLDLTSELAVLRSTNNRGVSAGVTGDTVPRASLNSRGSIDFGAGSVSAQDLTILRKDANTLSVRNQGDSSDKNFTCGALTLSGLLSPAAAGSQDIGATLLPFQNIYVGGAATNNNKIASAVCTGARTFTLPDANSNSVIPDTGASNNFLTGISSGGVISKAQPSSANLSDQSSLYNFKTVVVSGQSDVVADQVADTLTLVAGTGISITTNAGSDSITITNSGGSRYTSSAQTITSGGSLTLAHGLGSTPVKVWAVLTCTSGEVSFSSGNKVIWGTTGPGGIGGYGFNCVPDSTNLNIRYNSGAKVFSVNRKDTGAEAELTNANWTCTFYAEL